MNAEKLVEIKKYTREILKESSDPQHGWDHLDRVRKNALKIAALLEIKNIDLNLLQAVCVLHDIPVNLFKHSPAIKHFFENYAVNKYLPRILKDLDINESETGLLTNAISHHTFVIPYRRLNRDGNPYLKIMQDADSIDFFSYEREKSFDMHVHKYLSYKIASFASKKFNQWKKELGPVS